MVILKVLVDNNIFRSSSVCVVALISIVATRKSTCRVVRYMYEDIYVHVLSDNLLCGDDHYGKLVRFLFFDTRAYLLTGID